MVRLAADIRTSGLPPARVIVDAAVLAAAGPVGVQLARVLRGVLARSDEVGPGEPDDDLAAGVNLPATITHEGPAGRGDRLVGGRGSGPRTVSVRADVPVADFTVAHLRAMVALVLRAVGELVGGAEPLRGRTYVVSPHPPARRSAPDDGVSLDQIGGLADVVAQFREVVVSFQHADVMARWGARRPQGILLYGPPGTGKTMLARALANEIGASLREIRTPEILDKWLGGSERNIKQIFQDARRYREPTVLLFDEFDSIISYAGAGGDAASQAINAVAGIFKQEMNGLIEANPNVIVVATTNFPQRVDASLIRSGRFDLKLAIPVPDADARAEILAKKIRALAERHEGPGFRMFTDDIEVTELAQAAAGMTGADLEEVLRRLQLAKAMREARVGRSEPISHADLAAAIADLRR